MTPLPPTFATARRPELDDAVDGAIARIRERMLPFGGSFAALGDVLTETTRGGKRFRPALVVSTIEALGGEVDAAGWSTAAAFELLHAAFLVHDDIIDNDLTRRGVPNVLGAMRTHADTLGVSPASADSIATASGLLAGDLLLHEAQRLVALAPVAVEPRTRLLDLLDEAVLVSAAGELADAVHAARPDVPTDAILAATHDKTAVYSFAAPLRAGAVLAGADSRVERILAECGSGLGLAFQLVDDLIGAFGTADQAGRESGADLREAKQTVLIALARSSHDWPGVQAALAEAPTGPIAVQRAQTALAASGARRDLEQIVRDRVALVRRSARDGGLPVSAVRLLDELADAIEARIP